MERVADITSVTQTFINRLVWGNGYILVVGKPTRGDSLLDIYLVRLEGELITCETVQGISDHYGVLLDVEWGGLYRETQEKRLIPMYHKKKCWDFNIFFGTNCQLGQIMVVA